MQQPTSLFLVPQRRMRPGAFATSYVVQAAALLLLVQVAVVRPQILTPKKQYQYTALTAVPLETYASKPKVRVIPRPVHPLVAPKIEAKLELPKHVAPAETPQTRREQFPRMEAAPQVAQAAAKKPEVQTGVFGGGGSSAQATTNRPAREVQTGGFGDPNGIKGEGKPGARAVVASLGSFDLPKGPGYGNGTGGARGVRGTVVSTGFGNGVASAPVSAGGHTRAAIQQGGFGDARPMEPAAKVQRQAVKPALTPVEILSKPKPVYTAEARELKIEGEVLLEVRFAGNGELQVLRVIRGLGHGLDEAAQRAAKQIRFRPARQDGAAVDSIASLHVVFQLAY